MNPEDQIIIDGYLSGESDAIRQISDWIKRAAIPSRKDLPLQIEDAQQDAHLRVLRALRANQFRGESSLKTYVSRITSHACLDLIRKQRRPIIDPPADSAPNDPHELMEFLKKSSPECWELWKMIIDGMSRPEMCQVLGIEDGALRKRVYDCRKKAAALKK